MRKRFLAALLSLCMALALLPGTALAGELFGSDVYTSYPVTGGIIYFYEGWIVGYWGEITEVDIPDTIDGEPVININKFSFSSCTSLTSVTIPSSVTGIGEYAFDGCSNLTSVTRRGDSAASLTSVTIPEGVTSIGEYAFYGCSSLTSVTIPEGVTSIEENAFYGCSSLTSVTIPEGVTSIGERAFNGCSSLTSVTIPSSVTSIGENAFYGCSSLTSVIIPSSVTSIGDGAFSGCSNLLAFSVAAGNSAYASVDGVLFSKDMTSLICCPLGKLGSYSVPSGVTSIGENAFYGCSSLTSVIIPSSVTSIGENAFYGCSSLTSVTITSGVTSIGASAFKMCSNLTSVTIPSSVTSIGKAAFLSFLVSKDSDGVYHLQDNSSLTDVYYGGSETDWNAIEIGTENGSLLRATIHYNSAPTAYATTYSILVDGKTVAFDAYALRDENGNDTNYLKLRDVAHVLNGSAAQFNVGWDGSTGSISLTTGAAYTTPNGSEMSTPFSGNQPYRVSGSAILVNGVKADLSAITLTDANGGGYTYFKLRDLGKYLGFDVDWDDAARAIIIDTTRPYSE